MEPGYAGWRSISGAHLKTRTPQHPSANAAREPVGRSEGKWWDSRQMLDAPDCGSLAYKEKFLLSELFKPLLLVHYFH